MAVLVAFSNGPNLKVWWNKPQGSLERWRQGACSQVHVQGGGQSFRVVRCRGESPGDDPTWVYEEPSLSGHSPAPTQFSHHILTRSYSGIYIQHEPFQKKVG